MPLPWLNVCIDVLCTSTLLHESNPGIFYISNLFRPSTTISHNIKLPLLENPRSSHWHEPPDHNGIQQDSVCASTPQKLLRNCMKNVTKGLWIRLGCYLLRLRIDTWPHLWCPGCWWILNGLDLLQHVWMNWDQGKLEAWSTLWGLYCCLCHAFPCSFYGVVEYIVLLEGPVPSRSTFA